MGQQAPRPVRDFDVRLVEEIRAYHALNPGARDSIDGIVWWITLQRLSFDRADVELAVAWLVSTGDLKSHPLSDGTIVFSRGAPAGDAK
jgi:hypothetical protein